MSIDKMVDEVGYNLSDSQQAKIKGCVITLVHLLSHGKLIDFLLERDKIRDILWVKGEFLKKRDNRFCKTIISLPIYNWSQLEFPV